MAPQPAATVMKFANQKRRSLQTPKRSISEEEEDKEL